LSKIESAAITRIRAAFPELRLRTIETIGRGWDSTAFLVDGETVFRLPSSGEAIEDAARPEVNLLTTLRGRLPIGAPDPVYVAPDFSFFGYGYLRGEPLDRRPELFSVQLWVDVVIAVESLVPVHAADAIGIRPFDGVERRLDLVRVARDRDHLSDVVAAFADTVLRDYGPCYDHAAAARSITMHGDLGLSHWLVDDGAYAVFDWSDACIAPVEHELANLLWTRGGWTLVDDASARYANATAYRPDRTLIALEHWANALSDVGAMLTGGVEASSSEILGVLTHLDALAAGR
jgi:aminoglycoside phosphotransferase (APT) family kinase protein